MNCKEQRGEGVLHPPSAPPTLSAPPIPPQFLPVLTLYWSVGPSRFQGSGLFFLSQLEEGMGL